MKVAIRILVIASLPLSIAASGPTSGCMAGMRKALIEGGFGGPIICSKKDATFALAGRTAGAGFSIYDYRYRFRPFMGSCTMHGGQRLVVMRGRKYVGHYMLLPHVTVTVRGTYVLLKGDEDWE